MPGAARSLLALLALTVACEWPIQAVAGEPDTAKACKMECPDYLKRKYPLSILESYTVSTCRGKTSIILKTKKNGFRCANRDHDWVKKAMQALDARTSFHPTTQSLPVANRHSGEAHLEVEGHAQPTKKISPTPYKTATLPVRTTGDPQPFVEGGLSRVEATTSSALLTPQPETMADKPTLQPDSIANHKIGTETLEGHTRLGEHVPPTQKGLEDLAGTTQRLMSPPVPFPGPDETSPQSPAFASETLANPSTRPSTNSSISKLLEFVTKDKTSSTIPTELSNSSDQHRLFFSSSSAEHELRSAEGATTQLPANSSSPSSRLSSSGRTSHSSVQFRGVIDAEREGDITEPPLSIGTGRTFSKPSDTLQIPGYRQETFIESTSISNPNAPPGTVVCNPSSQSMVQNYIIPVLSIGGVLCVLLAVGGLVYVKRNVCTKRSPKRQVQGVMYYPCDSQVESYPMELV